MVCVDGLEVDVAMMAKLVTCNSSHVFLRCVFSSCFESRASSSRILSLKSRPPLQYDPFFEVWRIEGGMIFCDDDGAAKLFFSYSKNNCETQTFSGLSSLDGSER